MLSLDKVMFPSLDFILLGFNGSLKFMQLRFEIEVGFFCLVDLGVHRLDFFYKRVNFLKRYLIVKAVINFWLCF
jgi:hypothetical protein